MGSFKGVSRLGSRFLVSTFAYWPSFHYAYTNDITFLNIPMTKHYHAIPTIHLHAGAGYLQAHELPELVHWEDAALHAMVDFKYIKAEAINPDEAIDTALHEVKKCSFHVLLVVNAEQEILGLVSTEDLLGEKPLKAIQERRLPRAEISVQMVMIPREEIVTLDLESLRHAKVGHIIETLHAHKQHYALVVKTDEITDAQTVRGLFSASLISKQLGRDITSAVSEAQSIAELQHNLHLHD